MLGVLRQKGVNKTILWIIAIIIILSFGVFGTAYRLDNYINSAGRMFGRNVSFKDFQQAYYETRDQAIIIYGDQFFKNGSRLNLVQETWDRLMLLTEAQKQKIKISDQELVTAIASVPVFQRNGQFDQWTYETLIRNPGVFDRPSTRDFEDGMRKQIMIKKLLEQIAPEQKLTEAQLRDEYDKRNEKLTLQYVLFNALEFGNKAQASNNDIKKYYDQHKNQYLVPVSIVLNYVQTKDKALADTLSKELLPGSDFASVAKKLKLEVHTSAPFTEDQPILTFASNPDNIKDFFAMKQGAYSKILEAPDGWQIVQLKEKINAHIAPLTGIKDKVRDDVLLEEGFSLAKPKADEALKKISSILKSKDFKTAARSLGLSVQETPAFGRREYIANVGLVQEFQQEADHLTTQKRLSGVVATSQGPAIIYLTKMEKPEGAAFASDKDNFRQQLAAEKRNQILITFISQLRLKANVISKIKSP